MVTVGFLHTAPSHVPAFDELVNDVDPSMIAVHVVEIALLEAARRLGSADSGAVADGVERAIRELVDAGAERVVCTCSTIGGTAEAVGRRCGVDVMRVDRAMAERAVAIGGRIAVLAALDSTIDPTVSLLRSAAAVSGTAPSIGATVVEGAWARFEAGDVEGYHALVADAIVRVGDEADVVVLAQASMARAAELVAIGDVDVPVLSSPRLAVEQVTRSA
jgi:hypothetical protein